MCSLATILRVKVVKSELGNASVRYNMRGRESYLPCSSII